MHIDRWVKASVVIAVIMGIPGWIGVFKPSTLSAPQQQVLPQGSSPAANKSDPVERTAMQDFLEVMRYVGPILSSGFLVLAVFMAFRKRPTVIDPTLESKLKIVSAFYGSDRVDEQDVGNVVRNHIKDGALVLSVDNNTLKCDPAVGKTKRLVVKYAYGNETVFEIVRPEYVRLVLPEDTWLKGEVEESRNRLKKASEKNDELTREVSQLIPGVEKLKFDLRTEKRRARPMVERAGTLRSYAGQADWLNKKLEEIWHLYDNDKIANEALIYPLGSSAIPDVIKEWRHKELWNFRIMYRSHIGAITAIDPSFHSNLIDDGFPRDGEKYLDVRRKMEAHAALLRDHADRLIRADAAGVEL